MFGSAPYVIFERRRFSPSTLCVLFIVILSPAAAAAASILYIFLFLQQYREREALPRAARVDLLAILRERWTPVASLIGSSYMYAMVGMDLAVYIDAEIL